MNLDDYVTTEPLPLESNGTDSVTTTTTDVDETSTEPECTQPNQNGVNGVRAKASDIETSIGLLREASSSEELGDSRAAGDSICSKETVNQTQTTVIPNHSTTATVTFNTQPMVTSDPNTVVTSDPQPAVTSDPQPTVTSDPQPPVTSDPQPVVTSDLQPPVISDPQPVVTSDPQPVVTSDPQPVVTSDLQPLVTSEPQPPVTSDLQVSHISDELQPPTSSELQGADDSLDGAFESFSQKVESDFQKADDLILNALAAGDGEGSSCHGNNANAIESSAKVSTPKKAPTGGKTRYEQERVISKLSRSLLSVGSLSLPAMFSNAKQKQSSDAHSATESAIIQDDVLVKAYQDSTSQPVTVATNGGQMSLDQAPSNTGLSLAMVAMATAQTISADMRADVDDMLQTLKQAKCAGKSIKQEFQSYEECVKALNEYLQKEAVTDDDSGGFDSDVLTQVNSAAEPYTELYHAALEKLQNMLKEMKVGDVKVTSDTSRKSVGVTSCEVDSEKSVHVTGSAEAGILGNVKAESVQYPEDSTGNQKADKLGKGADNISGDVPADKHDLGEVSSHKDKSGEVTLANVGRVHKADSRKKEGSHQRSTKNPASSSKVKHNGKTGNKQTGGQAASQMANEDLALGAVYMQRLSACLDQYTTDSASSPSDSDSTSGSDLTSGSESDDESETTSEVSEHSGSSSEDEEEDFDYEEEDYYGGEEEGGFYEGEGEGEESYDGVFEEVTGYMEDGHLDRCRSGHPRSAQVARSMPPGPSGDWYPESHPHLPHPSPGNRLPWQQHRPPRYNKNQSSHNFEQCHHQHQRSRERSHQRSHMSSPTAPPPFFPGLAPPPFPGLPQPGLPWQPVTPEFPSMPPFFSSYSTTPQLPPPPFPPDTNEELRLLWEQYHTLCGEQSIQQSLYCSQYYQQQARYHSQCATYYHSLHAQCEQRHRLATEFNRQRQVIRDTVNNVTRDASHLSHNESKL